MDLDRRPFPADRRFVLGALRTGRAMSPMTALVQVDVTEAWQKLRADDLSPTAFVIACVGRAVAAHPEVHAYRDWRGRLVMHRHVDITTMIEVPTSTGVFPLAHPIRNADTRPVSSITEELERIRSTPRSGGSGRLLLRWGTRAGALPGFADLFYRVARHSVAARRRMGTVSLSSVGMMLGGNGFAIGAPAIATLTVLVGGVAERPWVVDGIVTVRDILDLSVQIDHKVVDGAPAGRFGAMLRQLLEHPELVTW